MALSPEEAARMHPSVTLQVCPYLPLTNQSSSTEPARTALLAEL